MTGDVSRRRYARLTLPGPGRESAAAPTAVLALYPPDLREACERSLVSGRLLHQAGVRVPTVLDAACGGDGSEGDEGWVLLEDLGEATLYDLAGRPWADVEPVFEAAVDLLPRIAGLPRPAVASLNPPLDRELLLRELAMTREVFLEPEGLDVGPRLWGTLEHLCEALGDETPVPCHRDFGARNLIPLPARPAGTRDAHGHAGSRRRARPPGPAPRPAPLRPRLAAQRQPVPTGGRGGAPARPRAVAGGIEPGLRAGPARSPRELSPGGGPADAQGRRQLRRLRPARRRAPRRADPPHPGTGDRASAARAGDRGGRARARGALARRRVRRAPLC